MSKKKDTDNFVGGVAIVAIVVGVVTGVGGAAPNGDGGSSTGNPRISNASVRVGGATSNIPGGPAFMCTGTVIDQDSNRSGTLTLRVYYSSYSGRTCAVATTSSASSWSGPRGVFTINLHYASYAGHRWKRYARATSAGNANHSGAIFLPGTRNRCVVSRAVFTPADGGKKIAVSSGRSACH